VPAEGNGDLQTLICVLAARLRRCPTLLNPVPWQNWMAAYPGCTLQMKMLFRGWPVMVHDTHTRRRRRRSNSLVHCLKKCTKFVYHNKHGWPQRREENILLLKPTTDRRKASRGLSVTAALLVQVLVFSATVLTSAKSGQKFCQSWICLAGLAGWRACRSQSQNPINPGLFCRKNFHINIYFAVHLSEPVDHRCL